MAWINEKTLAHGVISYTIRSRKLGSKFLGCVNPEIAQAEKLEMTALEKRGRIKPNHPPEKKAVLFGDWIREYLAFKEHSTPLSYDKIADHLATAKKWFGDLPIDDSIEIQDEWAKRFRKYQQDRLRGFDPTVSGRVRPIKPSTLVSEWSTIRAALFRAARTGGLKQGDRWNLCQTSPIAELAIASAENEEDNEIHVFSSDELQAIYAVEPETQPVWEFIVNTGLRATEARCQLQAYVDSGITLPQCRLVHNPKKGLHLKGKRQRSIPLNEEAQEARNQIVFRRENDERFMVPQKIDWWKSHFTSNVRKAGIAEGSLNSLRHTFISRAANSGNVPIDYVRAWAGHSKLTTTQRYLHRLAEEDHAYIQHVKI